MNERTALSFVIFRVSSWIAFEGKDSIQEIALNHSKKAVESIEITTLALYGVWREKHLLFSFTPWLQPGDLGAIKTSEPF
ncbi:MAG TPA: hypothetical protein VES69_09565 [Pyrinomonadaceae bacterium]|nr:hypothetical protein [Pyrinomonadaceae bacterium]